MRSCPSHGGESVNKKARTRLIIATAVLVVVFAVGIVYVVTTQGAYYRQVSDLSAAMNGKNVKVGGAVVGGSIVRDAAGVHFTITDLTGKQGSVQVDYNGQMPATFAPGTDVVVTGTYAATGSLISADQLQTKCPSKYQGQASPAPQATP